DQANQGIGRQDVAEPDEQDVRQPDRQQDGQTTEVVGNEGPAFRAGPVQLQGHAGAEEDGEERDEFAVDPEKRLADDELISQVVVTAMREQPIGRTTQIGNIGQQNGQDGNAAQQVEGRE